MLGGTAFSLSSCGWCCFPILLLWVWCCFLLPPLGGAVSFPYFFGKVLLSSTLLWLALLLPLLLGGCFSLPPLGEGAFVFPSLLWVLLFLTHLPFLLGEVMFSPIFFCLALLLPFLLTTAFLILLSVFSPSFLGWCYSGASVLVSSFRFFFPFSQHFSVFHFFMFSNFVFIFPFFILLFHIFHY